MIYLKSFLVGIGGAVAASILWIIVAFFLPLSIPLLLGRIMNTGGAATASIESGSVLAAALIGFIIAAAWEMRRLRTI